MKLDDTYEKREIHDAWESIYRGDPLLDRRNDAIMDRILKLVRPAQDATFLDAGCGVGDHTARIARKGYRCIGVDISSTILKQARERMKALGLDERTSFRNEALEELTVEKESIDVVHCRGVLMHIPDWKAALRSLCSVVRPGGHIAILENNAASPYTRAYLLARRAVQNRVASRLVKTEGGVEFWTDEDGTPFVVRMASIPALQGALREFGIEPIHRFPTSLVAMEDFPRGVLRNGAVRVNHLAFRLRVPPALCKGNAIIGVKTG